MGLLSTIFPATDDAAAVERCRAAGGPTGLDVGGMTDIELETLLESVTGTAVAPGSGRGIDVGGEQWLSEVPPDLVTALAALAPEAFAEVAERWAATDELAGADPADLTPLIAELAALAGPATADGTRLYLWTSL